MRYRGSLHLSITAVAIVLTMIVGHRAFTTARGQKSIADRPAVVMAVAPIFIPFTIGNTGTAKATVEVKVDASGKVVSANLIDSSQGLYRDRTFEETAKRWQFAPAADGADLRAAHLTFTLRILPKGTPSHELTSIFSPPYQVEIRHEVFEPYTNVDPRHESSPLQRPMKKKQG
jgi:TonB family protein